MKSIKKNNSQDYHIVKIKNFREVVQYVYYRFVEYYKRKEGWDSPYKFSGFCLFAFLFIFNIFSIITFLYITILEKYLYRFLELPYKIADYKFGIKLLYGGGIAIISSIILYLLLGKTSYEEIYNKFQKETPKQRKKRKWFIIAYMILTAIIFLVLATIKNWDS
ncbi:hypothetical protein [Capnocytophaga felis]|uniref:Uncharacterized protein n=1 Tax=Capnocytophaga felis TaxID=2267611 RepID=A0A5M4BCM0_9FLAO|nr:hypothetical protein [Capnocytophaga felis]GET47102.1 hypothetical protein RCZ01_24040 [Capnocytophaga felis]GET49663.1 hypothetical protein RCZ02_24940 [Capnocytophaga felis]